MGNKQERNINNKEQPVSVNTDGKFSDVPGRLKPVHSSLREILTSPKGELVTDKDKPFNVKQEFDSFCKLVADKKEEADRTNEEPDDKKVENDTDIDENYDDIAVCNTKRTQTGTKQMAGQKPICIHLRRGTEGPAVKSHMNSHGCSTGVSSSLCPKTSQVSESSQFKSYCSQEQAELIICSKIGHASEKVYACDICSFMSKYPKSLKIHRRIHTGEKPYACDMCPYTCRQAPSLKKHKMIHTNEKPYSCDVCQYTCREAGHLKRHKMTHSDEQPYSCDMCQYTCRHPIQLKSHKLIHIYENPKEVNRNYRTSHDIVADESRSDLIYNMRDELKDTVNSKGLHDTVEVHYSHNEEQANVKPEPNVTSENSVAIKQEPDTDKENVSNVTQEPNTTCEEIVEVKEEPEISCDELDDIKVEFDSDSGSYYHDASAVDTMRLQEDSEQMMQTEPVSTEERESTQLTVMKNQARPHEWSDASPCADINQVCQTSYFEIPQSQERTEQITYDQMKHTSEKLYTCDMCPFTSRHVRSLKVHKRIHTGEKPYKCNICSFSCRQSSNLKQHKMIHTGEKPFSCDLCQYTCRAAGTLKRHKRTCIQPYSCDMCQYTCTQDNQLKKHKMTHRSEKLYSCDICSYTCRQAGNLKSHKRIHTGEKPFACDMCPYTCRQAANLKQHKMTHTGEKPFSCKFCQYTSKEAGNLKRHEMTHTGEKPYSCNICPYKCRQAWHLKKHKKIHANKK